MIELFLQIVITKGRKQTETNMFRMWLFINQTPKPCHNYLGSIPYPGHQGTQLKISRHLLTFFYPPPGMRFRILFYGNFEIGYKGF